MNITQTILVDLAPGQGASVTACVRPLSQRLPFTSLLLTNHAVQSREVRPWSSASLSHRHHHRSFRRRLDVCSTRWHMSLLHAFTSCTVVLWTTLESATHRTTSGYGEYTVVDRAGICCSVALYLVFYGLFQFLRVPIVVSILVCLYLLFFKMNRCAEKGNVMQQAKRVSMWGK